MGQRIKSKEIQKLDISKAAPTVLYNSLLVKITNAAVNRKHIEYYDKIDPTTTAMLEYDGYKVEKVKGINKIFYYISW